MQREDWDRRYAEVESLWSRTPNRFLVAEVSRSAPGRALDLACGEGRNSLWLARLGWQVVGVDFSRTAIEKARQRAADEAVDVHFLCADLLDYVPDPATYDLVLLFYLQLPANERRRVLERAARALAPAGTLVLVGHDLLNLSEGVGGPSDPAVLYTPDDIVADLRAADGVQIAIEKAERVLRDVDDADRPAIDALVRARRTA